ncbi:MAG TPA: SelB C-terminal domain-containing protein, partial [Pyrinomonadaceae bacterium]|nr:SelB C-terminal domain-containing protein [Pyrinomonadaceae bacterium]
VSREAVREKLFRFIDVHIFAAAIEALQKDGRVVLEKELLLVAGHAAVFTDAQKAAIDHLSKIYHGDDLEVPKLDEALAGAAKAGGIDAAQTRKLLQTLVTSKEIVKISEEFYFSRASIDSLVTRLRESVSGSDSRLMDVASFKELAGISRKYAIPLLEYFDREKITTRQGDKRHVN